MLHALACFRHMYLSMQVLAVLHALTRFLQVCGLLQGYERGLSFLRFVCKTERVIHEHCQMCAFHVDTQIALRQRASHVARSSKGCTMYPLASQAAQSL